MNTTLKRGDIVRRYNRNKGMYQYGVVADTLVFLENKCVTCVIYREKSQTFCTWTDVEEVFMRIEQESLPSRFCFLSDISKIFAHVRVDYSVTAHGETISKYNSTLLTPLTQVLDSDNLSAVIERCVNAGVFAEDKIFFNELAYWLSRCWANYDSVEFSFYRV